jgi:hypothetical protein
VFAVDRALVVVFFGVGVGWDSWTYAAYNAWYVWRLGDWETGGLEDMR